MVSPVIAAVIAVVAGVVAAAIAFFAGVSYRRKTAEAKIGSAEEEAKRLINDAMKAAQQKRKEALIEAKDEAFQLKAEADKEIKERRSELSRQERRLDQKEEAMDRKTAVLEQKETDLAKRSELVEARLDEIEQIKARELDKMETIAGLTAEDAKQLLLNRLDEQLTHEKAMHIAAFETQTKDESATQWPASSSARPWRALCRRPFQRSHGIRGAAVGDEMKAASSREGRNIRALETATGVDLIIDDTPEAITLSSFDPVRREVARMTLEKLISDGRIHPARIEETVEKCRRELELAMKREGEKAVMDVGVHGIHPDMVKLLGRLRYRTSYGQNVLNHSLEVAYLSGILAAELGVNVTQARRAGLLHDIGKALDHEIEGSHISIGVDIAKKYKENPAIIHAIEAHHGDVEAKTPLAFIVMAADAISAARPGARRENLESYIKRLESLEEIASGFEGVERSFAIQAGREVRIMVKPDAINDDALILLAHSISQKIEETLDYPGQIKVNVIRESRAVDYAK